MRTVTRKISLLLSPVAALILGVNSQAADALPSTVKTAAVNFRQGEVAVSDAGGSKSMDKDALQEKRETLERETAYAKAKLEAAKKKLAVQSAAGNTDQAAALQQEVNDWEARSKSTNEQLTALEAELDKMSGASQATQGLDTQIVLPGENLELIVNEDNSFNGRYQVRRGGYIILPQVGRVIIAGKTLPQAESEVKRALQASQLQRASVMLERIAGTDLETGPLVYLSGEFRSPRPYRIPQGTAASLVTVFLSSGGATDKGDLTRVRIMRMAGGRGVVEEVNLQKILDGNGLTSDVSLSDGDVVIIPAGSNNLVYLSGNVKRPGSYHLTAGEKLTVYGAILQGGGFARFADLKKTHVLRAMPDGTKAKLSVDVRSIQKGLRADVVLLPGDIIVVPEKWFSF